MRTRLALLAALALPLFAMERFNGRCQLSTTNTSSSTTVVRLISSGCTVTVFNSGTATLSTLFSDNGVTPLANPFTAQNLTTGQFFFYAADGTYDVQLTGGTPSISTQTIGAVSLGTGTAGLPDPGSNGMVARTAAATTAARTVTGTANEITVTNGNGVSGNPTLALADAFDIASHTSTKPIKSTASCPATCGVAEYCFDNDATAGQNTYACTSTNTWTLQGSGAPVNATYITQTANATLTNEQALSSLATGLVKNTTGTGVLSIAVAGDLPTHTHTESQITDLGTSVATPQTRQVNTSAPLGGGGALTGNLTLTCATCEVTTAKNGASGYAGLDGSARLPAAQFPALTGDVTTAGGALATTLANTGIGAGTYTKITVDTKGRATAGTTLVSGDLPAHNHAASQITSGQMALARGGTNADLSATGGANQFLKQTSAGGAVTVAAVVSGDIDEVIALADLTDVTAKRGNSTVVQMASNSASPTALDCARFDANGNIESAGGACGLGAPNVPALTDLRVVRTSSTVLTIGGNCTASAPCNVSIGATIYTFTGSATATITAGTGTAYIYVAQTGALTVGHNVTVTCSSCTSTGSVTAFPTGSVPLWTWTATAAAWDVSGGSDKRAMLGTKVIVSGSGVTISESGGIATASLSPATLNGTTWGDGTQASFAWTYDVSTGTDPVLTFGNGIFNVSTGTIQQGGTAVVLTSRTLTGGAGIAAIGDLSADRSIATASGETDFLASGALTCGAATQGRMQVHTTPLQYCDNAGTPTLRYAAYADSLGNPSASISREQTFCSGVASASSTLFLTVWNSTTCTNTTEGVAQEILVNSAGRIRNLRARASAAGAAAGSGIITLRVNAADTIVTCTIGTGTTCSDTTNQVNVAAGDRITVKMATAGAETLANVQVAFEF